MEKHNASGSTKVTPGSMFIPLDISLFAKVLNHKEDKVNSTKIKLRDTKTGMITIRMNKPKKLPKLDEKKKRKFYMIRIHMDKNGAVKRDVLNVTENEDGTLSTDSNLFSTYILGYVDEEETASSPSSGLTGGTAVVMPGAGGSGGTAATPTPVPSATPGTTASAAPSAAPGTTASADPSATPGTVTDTTPSAAPGAAPSAAPSAAPGTTASAAPSATPGTTPDTKPDVTPGTVTDTTPSAKPAQTVKTGKKVTKGNVKYKVTAASGSRTVTVTGAKSVKNIVIPASIKIEGKTYKVTSVANNAFKGNKKLVKITIGKNIRKIGRNAFKGCANLKKVTIKTTKLTAKMTGKNAFSGINKKAVIKVPKNKVKAYKKIIMARGAVKNVKVK